MTDSSVLHSPGFEMGFEYVRGLSYILSEIQSDRLLERPRI